MAKKKAMTANPKKKAAKAAAGPSTKEFTGAGKKSIRKREKVLGTPKAQRQSNTRIKKRQAGERGVARRVGAVNKRMAKLDRQFAKGKIDKATYSSKKMGHEVSKAKAARLSKSAASGAG